MTTDTSQEKMAGLTGAISAMIAGAAENLGQLLGVPVDFKLLTITSDGAQTPDSVEEDVHLGVAFAGAVTGDTWLALTGEDAESIVGMMTQDMDPAEDGLLGETGMSKLSEAMDQFMAGAATALSDSLGERVATISTNPEPHPDRADAVVVTCEGEIAAQTISKIVWQIDEALAKDLGARWLAATAPSAAPAASAPGPVPAAHPGPASAAPPIGGGVIDSVELDVAVELGNVAMTIGELLHMGEGSVVTLTQSVGDNVTMLANGTPVASGEVVVVDGTLGFRVSELITEAGA